MWSLATKLNSSLRTLKVCARFTEDGRMSVVQALKTNETLQDLELLRVVDGMNGLVRDEFRKLLWHHNVALRRITLFSWREIDNETPIRMLVEQNRPVRRVHDHLKGGTTSKGTGCGLLSLAS
jgi:hypothetical protein